MSADGQFIAPTSCLVDAAPHGFFQPVKRSDIDGLLSQHVIDRQKIAKVAETAESFFGGTLEHFLKGNLRGDDRRPTSGVVKAMFDEQGAVSHLNATYWQKALALTDVYDMMPQKRRNEWNESIREQKTPDFTPEIVIPTLQGLLESRERFLAERCDGIFRELSGEHVTNRPEGFGKRMILNYMLSYGSIRSEKAGFIHDLRTVIARFMGREEPGYWQNHLLVTELQKTTGEWHVVDGGALRIRLYKKGTAHLEVSEDMAWRLNAILSYLYPLAIPAAFREKKKQAKSFSLMSNPLPFSVLGFFAEDTRYMNDTTYELPIGDKSESRTAAREKAIEIIEMLGGVKVGPSRYEFDYDYRKVFKTLMLTGVVPDKVSHQYYPTPMAMAQRVVAQAAIEVGHDCLEPSAGFGGIARFMPVEQTTCVEITVLGARALRSKGFKTIERDFVAWAAEAYTAGTRVDRVCMNPPFSEGRADLHLNAALKLLRPNGRLVAILPSGARKREAPPGYSFDWSEILSNEFRDTTVSVVILTATRT